MCLRTQTAALMQALISGSYGCLDAAAETINARWGQGGSKGTLSRKLTGSLDFTVADVIALEDAAGRYPVTRYLARRLAPEESRPIRPIVAQAGRISVETGQAVAAILAASASAEANDAEAADREIQEAIDALAEARRAIRAMAD
jgi:hypothetical protein